MVDMRYCLLLSILPSITRTASLAPASLFASRRVIASRRLLASDDSISSSSKDSDGPIVDRDEHVRILNDSLERHIGKGLRCFTDTSCDEPDCWDDIHTSTRYALHSHGAKNDVDGPVNNYGNFGALGAFEMTYSQFTRIPAGRVANPGLDQEEWSQVLQRVRSMKKEGFLQSYKGFRCTIKQISFFIRDAMVRFLVSMAVNILSQSF